MTSLEWDVVTLFPEVITAYVGTGILGRAVDRGLLRVRVHQLRDFARDRHRTVDDYPYGGGAGMVLKPEPIFRAVEAIRRERPRSRVVLLSPQGRVFTQEAAKEMAARDRAVTLICGRYEGVDERVAEHLADEEVSIGDYVISGGELAALVVLDAVSRCLPGVVGDEESVRSDSFFQGLLKHPQYTRPEIYRGLAVPPVLLSGHHEEIRRYQRGRALAKTLEMRPELLARADLGPEDRDLLQRIRGEAEA